MKNLIVAAIHKVTQADPALDVDGNPTGTEVRDRFIRMLIAELFPECPSVEIPTLTDPVENLTEGMKTLTIKEEKKKPGRKPKAKPEGTNIAKLNATQKKKLAQLAPEGDETALLAYLNGLSADEFDSKKIDDHIRACFAPPKKEEEKVELELVIVEFEGKEYYVNEESKRVYVPKGEADADGHYAGWDPVGYVGMAEFKDMSLD